MDNIIINAIRLPSNVPTLSEWGMIAMAALLGILAFVVLRRKAVHA